MVMATQGGSVHLTTNNEMTETTATGDGTLTASGTGGGSATGGSPVTMQAIIILYLTAGDDNK